MTVIISYNLDFSAVLTPVTGDVANVAVAGLTNGGFVVLADDGANGGVTGGESSGQYLNDELIQTDSTQVFGTTPAAAQLTNGNVVVVTANYDFITYRIQTVAGVSVLPYVTIDDSDTSNPDVTALQNGGFVIALQDNFSITDNDIDLRFFDAAGTQTNSVIVNSNSEDDRNAAVATLDNGNVVVTWQRNEGGQSAIWMSIFDQTGAVVLDDIAVDVIGSSLANPQVTATTEGFAILYQDDGWNTGGSDITMKTYNSAGGNLTIHNVSNPNLVASDSRETNVQVTRLPDGYLGVSWQNAVNVDFDAKTLVIADDGSTQSSTRTIVGADNAINDQTNPDLTFFGQSSIASFVDSSGTGIEGEIMTVRIIHTSDGAADLMTGGQLFDSFYGGTRNVVSYANSSGGVVVDLRNGTGSSSDAQGDLFYGIDRVVGSDFRDVLVGNVDDNVLNGGGGNDVLIGIAGNDTYFVDATGDVIEETVGGGTNDRVAASVSYTLAAGVAVEQLQTTASGGTGAINLTGNALAQRIFGNAGANVLSDGGFGAADTLTGAAGNDTHIVNNAGTLIVERSGQGTADRAAASVSFVLAADDDIERFTTTSSGAVAAINLTGNALAQTITGNNGINVLSDGGGAGLDTLTGLGGNDTYIVRNAGSLIVEGTGQGTADRVAAGVSFSLAADDNIEVLTTSSSAGTAAINLAGNALSQQITGNAGANVLNGRAGSDTLTGLGGADSFVFNAALGATNIDTVTDFNVAADTIRLENAIFTGLVAGALTAAAFRSNTTGQAADATDRIIYETDTGVLWYDADGSGAGATRVGFADLAGGLSMSASEFSVI